VRSEDRCPPQRAQARARSRARLLLSATDGPSRAADAVGGAGHRDAACAGGVRGCGEFQRADGGCAGGAVERGWEVVGSVGGGGGGVQGGGLHG